MSFLCFFLGVALYPQTINIIIPSRPQSISEESIIVFLLSSKKPFSCLFSLYLSLSLSDSRLPLSSSLSALCGYQIEIIVLLANRWFGVLQSLSSSLDLC